MKFISAVTSLQYHSNNSSNRPHHHPSQSQQQHPSQSQQQHPSQSQQQHPSQLQHVMVSSGHMPGPVPSRLPQKRDSRIPGLGVPKQVHSQSPSQFQSQCNGTVNGRRVRAPTPSSTGSSSQSQSKSTLSDVSSSSRRSSSPASNASSLSQQSKSMTGSSSLIPGAPEIVINTRRINTTDRSNYSRPAIRPPRPTSIPSAPNHALHPTVASIGGSTIPPGHFSPAKSSQPMITPRVDSHSKLAKNVLSCMASNNGSSSGSSSCNNGSSSGSSSCNNGSSNIGISSCTNLAREKASQEMQNGSRKSETQQAGTGPNVHHQSSSPPHSNTSPSSSSSIRSTGSSPSSSLTSSASPSTTSSSPNSNDNTIVNTDHLSNKENSSFNSSSGPSTNENHMKESKSNNLMSQIVNGGNVGPPSLSLLNSGGSSLPSSPAKISLSSGNFLSRTSSPGHQFISQAYHYNNGRTMSEDFNHSSTYSDSECTMRKSSKVNILYSYSPSARSNFPAISEIAGVIESCTNLSNNNSNLIENNSLLTKCSNKAMSQLESTSSNNFAPSCSSRKDQSVSNVSSTPNMDQRVDQRVLQLNNTLHRSSPPIGAELENNITVSKYPSLRNLSSSGHQHPPLANGSILTMPSSTISSCIAASQQQFRRLSKNSDLRGSAASLLSSSSNFSSAEDKQGNEIKKLRNELSRANEKVATLSTQLLTSTQMVAAFEQSLASTITRFQQLSVSAENKDREISRLKCTIDSLRKQYDSLLAKEGNSTSGEGRNHSESINGEASDRESIKGGGVEGGQPSKMKKLKGTRSGSKDRGESDGERSGPGWLRGSITRAFRKNSRPRTRSGNDSGSDADSSSSRTNLNVLDPQGFRSMPGTPVHSPRVVNVTNQIDEELTGLEVLELKSRLQEKEKALTDIRLEALSVAHQMDGLKESNARMRSEIETLKVENRRLQRMVQRQSITSSVGSLNSCADSALTFTSEGKENNLDKSPLEKRLKNFNSDSDLDPLLNALMKLKDATGNN